MNISNPKEVPTYCLYIYPYPRDMPTYHGDVAVWGLDPVLWLVAAGVGGGGGGRLLVLLILQHHTSHLTAISSF